MHRRTNDGSSVPAPRPNRPNAFAPEFLEQLRDTPEPLTAAEADLAGPWKVEPVPGHPGSYAVLREWESLERGDLPEAVFLDEETAALCAAGLPLSHRELLFHLAEVEQRDAPVAAGSAGYPVSAVYGEQGPRVCGWLRHFNLQLVRDLHLLEALVRRPRSLAEVNLAAGGGALDQVGRFLAERQRS
jgi:hypothetical protein